MDRGLDVRNGFIRYWNPDRTIKQKRTVLAFGATAGRFLSASWAVGVTGELWGFSMGNDTLFIERAEGHVLGIFVRRYWWQKKVGPINRPYRLSLFIEGSLGGTNLAMRPGQIVETGPFGTGLPFFLGSLAAGGRLQVLPRVYLGIDARVFGSYQEGIFLAATDSMTFGLDLIW